MQSRSKSLLMASLAGVVVVAAASKTVSSATSPAPLYIVRATGGFVGFTNPPSSNRVWLYVAKNRYYGATFRLTNAEPHAILPWNVRVQVRSTGAGTDGTGWDTVFDDYWAGMPGVVQPGAVGEFRVELPLKTPWRVCIIYSTDWTDTQKQYSGQYEVISREFAADITGKVTLVGTPPKEIVIQPLMDDPYCGKLLTNGPVTTRNYLVSADNGLANTFVYVKAGLEGKKFEIPNVPEPVLNFGCLPEPYVLGVMVNQKLKIRAVDVVPDNVHSSSPHSRNAFNYTLMPKGQSDELSFGVPELPVTLKCDVHNWSYSYIGVFDHPFFAVTDTDGSFQISGLPPGKYTLEAFHRLAGKVTREITVGADNQKMDFTLKVPAPR